jgi:hypothetical protein
MWSQSLLSKLNGANGEVGSEAAYPFTGIILILCSNLLTKFQYITFYFKDNYL